MNNSQLNLALNKMLRILLLITLVTSFVLISSCGLPASTTPSFTVTIPPLAAILSEICTGRAEVKCLTRPGMSPHGYEPRPYDAHAALDAKALFYVHEDIDGWALKIPAKKTISLFEMVPEEMRLIYGDDHESHGEEGHVHEGPWNPHFWGDPSVVAAILPSLKEQLIAHDPEGEIFYSQNTDQFVAKLKSLEKEIKTSLNSIPKKAIATFHPSWDYYFNCFEIDVAGSITVFPGKDPTIKYINELVKELADNQVEVICTEVQLPERPAKVVAEALARKTGGEQPALCELDPIGGTPDRITYTDLLLFNTQQLVTAMQ